jgi:histidine triad (HIT) family protein
VADSMKPCPFCNYDGPVIDFMIANGIETFFIEPLNPVTPGHILAIPRWHTKHFSAYPEITAEVFRAAAYFCQARQLGPMNLITSKGKEATQTVRHLHVHLVPRAMHDGLKLPWSE